MNFELKNEKNVISASGILELELERRFELLTLTSAQTYTVQNFENLGNIFELEEKKQKMIVFNLYLILYLYQSLDKINIQIFHLKQNIRYS